MTACVIKDDEKKDIHICSECKISEKTFKNVPYHSVKKEANGLYKKDKVITYSHSFKTIVPFPNGVKTRTPKVSKRQGADCRMLAVIRESQASSFANASSQQDETEKSWATMVTLRLCENNTPNKFRAPINPVLGSVCELSTSTALVEKENKNDKSSKFSHS